MEDEKHVLPSAHPRLAVVRACGCGVLCVAVAVHDVEVRKVEKTCQSCGWREMSKKPCGFCDNHEHWKQKPPQPPTVLELLEAEVNIACSLAQAATSASSAIRLHGEILGLRRAIEIVKGAQK